ncbi:MAG TPA: hypothetical protein VFY39_10750 [Gammaproteobacteria bacterium]|nr:hypothetical protein [Gammaproteobacteria bacterium]
MASRANPPDRVEAFRKLPDWTGIWIATAALDTDVGGRPKDIRVYTLASGHPPYNATWEAQYQARLKQAGQGVFKSCNMDYPTIMQSPQPFELTVTPEETLFTAGDGSIRHIYTDGRGHTPADELIPSRMGDSVGHWEGDTLVVETIGRRAGPTLLGGLISYSDAALFLERIRMKDRNTLEDDLVVEDPTALTAPWKLTFNYERVTYTNHLVAYECDDDRIEIVDGKARIAPP